MNAVGKSRETQESYYMGWYVGGWNCDKNGKSRDALAILDADLKLIGNPWRGNLRKVINAAADGGDWINRLFGLCRAVPPSRSRITLAIDTPLGFSDAFIRLVTRKDHEGENRQIGDQPLPVQAHRAFSVRAWPEAFVGDQGHDRQSGDQGDTRPIQDSRRRFSVAAF